MLMLYPNGRRRLRPLICIFWRGWELPCSFWMSILLTDKKKKYAQPYHVRWTGFVWIELNHIILVIQKHRSFLQLLHACFFAPQLPVSITHRFLLLGLFLFIWPFNSMKSMKPTSRFWTQTLGSRSWRSYHMFAEVKQIRVSWDYGVGFADLCMKLRLCSFYKWLKYNWVDLLSWV